MTPMTKRGRRRRLAWASISWRVNWKNSTLHLRMRAEESLLAVLNNEEEPLEVRRRALESIAYSSEAGVRQLIEDGYYSVR